MSNVQTLLLPDPHPLDERLGKSFFRAAPRQPGVYLMRDQADRVLYIGKARNLRQRLNSYRLANPDRMARRHLRLIRLVTRIELQLCADEATALAREAELLLELKPRFNRAGVWRPQPKFLAWRFTGHTLEIAVAETVQPAWHSSGPLNSAAWYLQKTLARLFWLTLQTERSFHEMPVGWAQAQRSECLIIPCPIRHADINDALRNFFEHGTEHLCGWFETQLAARLHPFEQTVIAAELETLKQFQNKRARKPSASESV